MPATAPVQKQQGLNQVVINKVQRMIEDRQGDVMDTINRLLSEGRIAQDFIAPIGVSQRSKERHVISFKAEGRVQMAMPEGNFNLHGNAISQISAFPPNTSASFPPGMFGRNSCAPPS